MQKKIVGFDKDLGSDGAKVNGALGIDGENLVANVAVTYPLAKVIEPVMKGVDNLVDKLEALIPGDQKGLAAKLKQEAREEILELIANQAKA